MNKITLKVPGHDDVIFDSYEDLNVIWMVLDDYKDVKLEVINEDKQNLEDNIKEEDNKVEESLVVNEDIESVDETNNTTKLVYPIPKNVVFTQRFQDRVEKEITNILNAVYPNLFTVLSTQYSESSIPDTMNIAIDIKANGDNSFTQLNQLDDNVRYIIDDMVSYYN